jgi:iron(III) transport system permease protein
MKRFAIPIALLAFVYVGYFAYPLFEIVRESLMVGDRFSLESYFDLMTSTASAEAMWNSVWVSMLSVVCSAVVGLFLAFVFTQCDFPFRRVIAGIAVLPIALPPLVGVIAFLFVFGESGFLPRLTERAFGASFFSLEGIPAIVAVHTYSFYVYFYLFASSALRTLEASQLEAAHIMGSSAVRTCRKVLIPHLRQAILGAAMLTFMASMASFSAPLIFGGDKRFMTLQIYNAKLNGEMNVAAANAIAVTLVSVFVFVVLRLVGDDVATRTKGAARHGVLHLNPVVKFVLVGIAGAVLVIELLPLITIFVISFAREGSWTWQLLPGAYSLENYAMLLRDEHVFEPIRNSVVMSLLAVAASVIVGVNAAFFITKGKLGRSRFVVDVLATLPYAVPGTVVAIGLILAFNTPRVFSVQTILVGTFWILPLAYFVRLFPLVVRSTSASLAQLDDSLLEAAATFGARALRTFRKVVLPLILPGILSGALLVMITGLGEFVSSILLYSFSSRPISVEILAQMRAYNFGAAAAYSIVLLLIVSVASIAFNFLSKKKYLRT